MSNTHMLIQNVIIFKRYVRDVFFKENKLTVVYYGNKTERFELISAPTEEEIILFKKELEDRDFSGSYTSDGTIDRYINTRGNIFIGRIIQSMYAKQENPALIVNYLCGRTLILKLDTPLTQEEMTSLLTNVCLIQAAPCYPSGSQECACLLDVASI